MKKFILSMIILSLIAVAYVFGVNSYVKDVTSKYMITTSEHIDNIDAIVVLGCKVDGEKLSLMLTDRVEKGVEAYNKGLSDKILMSGDHEFDDYNEVDPMKDYAMILGVNEEDILLDPYGLNTYDSLYRLKNEYHYDKVIIISQQYHLYRALYIAENLGIEAYGIASSGEHYPGQTYRELREIIARNKDFVQCLIKPDSKY